MKHNSSYGINIRKKTPMHQKITDIFKGDRSSLLDTSLIIFIWVTTQIIINPVGDFPLNDDWAYGWSVKEFLETGDYKLSDWTATNLIPQIFWGVLFCLPFGFSFTALRVSTLLLGLFGVLATYGLLREMDNHPNYAVLGAFVLAFNPIYFALSNTFMSDVPSLSLCLISFYLILRGYKYNSSFELISGILLALVAVLNRQSSIVLLVAFGFSYIVIQAAKGISLKAISIAFTPVVAGLYLNSLYAHWLDVNELKPIMFGFQIKEIQAGIALGFSYIASIYIKNLFTIFIYLGLFLLPILILKSEAIFQSFSNKQKKTIQYATVSIGVAATTFAVLVDRMPLMGNVLEAFSLGPQALAGYYSFLQINEYRLIHLTWIILTVLGVLGGCLLILCFFITLKQLLREFRNSEGCKEIFQFYRSFKSRSRPLQNKIQQWNIPEYKQFALLFSISAIATYLSLISILDNGLFDRYLIFLIPFFLLLVPNLTAKIHNKSFSSKALVITLSCLLFLSGFTVSATHDYLASNRVRWEALNILVMQEGVSPEVINGGMEFGGWYFGNRLATCNADPAQLEPPSWASFSCLWGTEKNSASGSYVVSFESKAGYTVESIYPFQRWLPLRRETLYVLRRL